MTKAVRGAIQVPENSVEAITRASIRLVTEVLRVNELAENQLVSILFSVTDDLTAASPATGLRTRGFAGTPLFCAQEARLDGGMPRVLRVLVTWDAPETRTTVPVYLDGAESLRPDLGNGVNE